MVYTIAEARRRFSDLVKRAVYMGETVTIGTRGKPEAALISAEELRRLRELELERDARFLQEAVRRSTGTASIGEVLKAWREMHPSPPTADSASRAPKRMGGRR